MCLGRYLDRVDFSLCLFYPRPREVAVRNRTGRQDTIGGRKIPGAPLCSVKEQQRGDDDGDVLLHAYILI